MAHSVHLLLIENGAGDRYPRRVRTTSGSRRARRRRSGRRERRADDFKAHLSMRDRLER